MNPSLPVSEAGAAPGDGSPPPALQPVLPEESPQAEVSASTEDMSHVLRIMPLTFRRSLSP